VPDERAQEAIARLFNQERAPSLLRAAAIVITLTRLSAKESMVRAQYTNVLIVLGCGALAGILPVRALWTAGLQRSPRTIQEAGIIAHAKGLYCVSDERDGIPLHILVVSELPLTQEEAGGLRMNRPNHPGWRGVVKIYGDRRMALWNYDPTCSVVWGGVFVYGDPEMILKLTGMLPEHDRTDE
jgi:hypothetical protein